MKILPLTFVFLTVILPCKNTIGQEANSAAAAETGKTIVNPHFTGNHCQECHVEEKPQKGQAGLKYEGDDIKLCNSCHETEFARADIHPVGVTLLGEMKANFPVDWPLHEGKLSCLTCHDAYLQMAKNFPIKMTNPKFVRGGPYKALSDFCFSCHHEEEYQKTNPHRQLDDQGNIIEKSCLLCHLSVPDPQVTENIGQASFKGELAMYCISCHAKERSGHPARGDHLVILPDSMKKSLTAQMHTLIVDLPLDGQTIFCGTCHNPHQKGVIQREAAKRGSGEQFFLRLNGHYELCISCHADKKIEQEKQEDQAKQDYRQFSAKIVSTHEPVLQNKCKACHAITADNMGKPERAFLCFKEGCHKPELIENKYLHERSVLDNCSLCHRSHSSGHKKLLRNEPDEQCRTCHPLIRNEKEDAFKSIDLTKSTEDHHIFMRYLKTTPVPAGYDCGFCHSPQHKKQIVQLNMRVCSECHIYIQSIFAKAAKSNFNVHQTFKEKSCIVCHYPHTGPYPYQLREEPNSYLREGNDEKVPTETTGTEEGQKMEDAEDGSANQSEDR